MEKKIIKNFLSPILGNHNIQNILAAICVTRGIEISYLMIKKALKNFQGVNRRFTILHRDKNNLIIDDYAHHPVEIKATLNSLRLITRKRIISIFEPHRYSRLFGMFDDFIESFSESDCIYVLPIYSAGEKNNWGVTSQSFYNSLKKKYKNKSIFFVQNEKKFFKSLKDFVYKEDKIIFLGAGSSSLIAQRFKEYFLG